MKVPWRRYKGNEILPMKTKAGFARNRFKDGENRIARMKKMPAKAPIYLSTEPIHQLCQKAGM